MEIEVTKEEVVSMNDAQLVELLGDVEEQIECIGYAINHDCVMDGSYLHEQYKYELKNYQLMLVWIMGEMIRRELM